MAHVPARARARRRRVLLASFLPLAAITLLACRDTSRSTGAAQPGSAGPAASAAAAPTAAAGDGLHRYTVRAEIVRLPDPAAPRREVALRHEAIDDFADASGKVVGMGAMVMPFELAPGVSLDGVGVGEKVEARFAVGWSPPVLRVEELRKLPASTALEFRAARPPAAHP